MLAFSWLMWAWYYLNWKDHATLTPNLILSQNSPKNIILQYFIISFVLLIVGIAFVLLRFIASRIVEYKTTEFTDLCVVSNISIIIFDDIFHGYYIHGQAPSGKSDDTLDELSNMLVEEAEGRYKPRGLETSAAKATGSSAEYSTYEIFISNELRDEYDNLFQMQSYDTPKKKDTMTQSEYIEKKHFYQKFRKYLKNTDINDRSNTIANIKKLLNAELKSKIIKVFTEPTKYVKDMGWMHRLFNMPSTEIIGRTREEIVFFKEKNESFRNVLLLGIEWELYIWSLYWILFIYILSDSLTLGVFITYIIDVLVVKTKRYFGEKNLSKWTMIDSRFIV